MDLKLKGKRALVCGSSKGIGRACAEELARLGCRVTLLARNEQLLAEVSTSFPEGALGGVIAVDVNDKEALGRAIESDLKEHGAFHILVNNSGGPPGGLIRHAKAQEFQNAMDTHLFTNVLLSQLIIPGMVDEGFGRIINIISTSVKMPIPGLGVSNTTRGAVASWAKTLAGEVAASGITVNNVLPGATETERLHEVIVNKAGTAGVSPEIMQQQLTDEIPAGRFGRVEEIAAVVAFLASEAASYVNGVSIPVDGGRTGCI